MHVRRKLQGQWALSTRAVWIQSRAQRRTAKNHVFGAVFSDAQKMWQVSREEDVRHRQAESSNEGVSVVMSGRPERERQEWSVVRETPNGASARASCIEPKHLR